MRGGPVCVLGLGVGLLLGGCSAGGPVSDAEASIVASSLTSAARLAVESDDDDRYCGVVAADAALCENSWANWEKRGSPMPDFDTLEVAIEAVGDGSQRLTFTGSYVDGGTFANEVTVANTGSGPRADDPIFWIDD